MALGFGLGFFSPLLVASQEADSAAPRAQWKSTRQCSLKASQPKAKQGHNICVQFCRAFCPLVIG